MRPQRKAETWSASILVPTQTHELILLVRHISAHKREIKSEIRTGIAVSIGSNFAAGRIRKTLWLDKVMRRRPLFFMVLRIGLFFIVTWGAVIAFIEFYQVRINIELCDSIGGKFGYSCMGTSLINVEQTRSFPFLMGVLGVALTTLVALGLQMAGSLWSLRRKLSHNQNAHSDAEPS